MKILLTGATGYIGRQLLPELVKMGHQVVCLVRNPQRLQLPAFLAKKVEIVQSDLLKPETLASIPADIEAAYYLVHSMSQSVKHFVELERRSAEYFIHALQPTGCRQVIYLSGMTTDEEPSPHLRSRMAVEAILKQSRFHVTTLRAGIIVGYGSASFEIICDLVEKLPVMVAPKWLKVPHQPIAIRDVIYYLNAVLDNANCFNRSFDIGGPNIITYKEMLLEMARIRGLKRYILTVPVLTPRLSSYWLYFVTSTSFSLARSLVESMKHPVLVRDDSIQKIIPHACLSFEEAVSRALARIEGEEVISS